MSIYLTIRNAIAHRRLQSRIRDCEVNIATALDHIDFGKTMLHCYERKHAELTAELARLQSPAEVRRTVTEPI